MNKFVLTHKMQRHVPQNLKNHKLFVALNDINLENKKKKKDQKYEMRNSQFCVEFLFSQITSREKIQMLEKENVAICKIIDVCFNYRYTREIGIKN